MLHDEFKEELIHVLRDYSEKFKDQASIPANRAEDLAHFTHILESNTNALSIRRHFMTRFNKMQGEMDVLALLLPSLLDFCPLRNSLRTVLFNEKYSEDNLKDAYLLRIDEPRDTEQEDRLQAEIRQLQATINRLYAENRMLSEEKEKLQEENARLKKQYDDNRVNEQMIYQEIQQENNRLKALIQQKEEENRRLNQSLREKDNIILNNSNEITDLKETITTLEKSKEEKNRIIEDLKKDKEELLIRISRFYANKSKEDAKNTAATEKAEKRYRFF